MEIKNQKIDLIAIDIDGTLLDSSHSLPRKNIRAMKKVSKKGIKVVLCSGRQFGDMYNIAKHCKLTKFDTYLISCNGSGIFNIKTKEELYSSIIQSTLVNDIWDFTFKSGGDLTLLSHDEKHIYGYRNSWLIESKINIDWVVSEFKIIKKEELKDLKIAKAILVYPSSHTRDFEFIQLKKKFGNIISPTLGGSLTIEINAKDVNKWTGIVRLADMLKIPHKNIMALGDGGNDLEMLSNAGLGIAPANAMYLAKEAAAVTYPKSNDENFVASVLKEYILEPL